MASIIYTVMRDRANVYTTTKDENNDPVETLLYEQIRCLFVEDGKLRRDWVRNADLREIRACCKFDGDKNINYDDVVKILDDDLEEYSDGSMSFRVVDKEKPKNLHTGNIDHTRVMLA
jgi:hypothetical protein